jgi:SAM-dependent methyltransferase
MMDALPDDAFVMLDPAVEILDNDLAGYRLLCHGDGEVGMVVPPGEGLIEFVATLMENPVRVGTLRSTFDNQLLIETMLSSLSVYGLMHVTSEFAPSTEELARLRNLAAHKRKSLLRQFVVIDLDVPTSIEHLCARLNTGGHAPEVLFRCVRLEEHKLTLAELARLRQDGKVRMHNTVLETAFLTDNREICDSLLHLGASVKQIGVAWPTPSQHLRGLEEMTRNCVAVHVVMHPDLSILDAAVRAHVVAWVRLNFISGLYLQLEADLLWPAETVTADVSDELFLEVFNAVRALEEEIGDVMIATLPSDEVLLGKMERNPCFGELSELTKRFRLAYMRWRIPLLKSFEGENSWSQTPEAEEKLVRPEEDLLPNNPGLLQLQPGSLVVDVCGGLGRVARRLAPAVGQKGIVISIEMLRCLSDRARHFACQQQITNVHFRPGLAQRIPLPDGTVDAAVNEWTGGIWELGVGSAMIKEMTRVVRSNGRLAVTHRLVRIPLTQLGRLWVQYEEIYSWMRDAFLHPELTILTERIWGQIVPTLVGENATLWRRQYMPRLINPHDVTYDSDESPGAHADVFLTIVAQRR